MYCSPHKQTVNLDTAVGSVPRPSALSRLCSCSERTQPKLTPNVENKRERTEQTTIYTDKAN
eukprot:3861492-Amphidinium_carterae.1